MGLRPLLLALACLGAASVLGAGCASLTVDEEAHARVSAIPLEQRRLEPLLEEAVRVAVGRAIPVRCWTRSEWPVILEESLAPIGQLDPRNVLGAAVTDGVAETINLSARVCEPLAALAAQPVLPSAGAPALDLAQALVTVGHEAGHLVAALTTEAEAECFGAQHVSSVAQALGLTEAEGDLLASLYWGEVYPRSDPRYRSPECRDGGVLDLEPWSTTWP
jgi:hypothetical protein